MPNSTYIKLFSICKKHNCLRMTSLKNLRVKGKQSCVFCLKQYKSISIII